MSRRLRVTQGHKTTRVSIKSCPTCDKLPPRPQRLGFTTWQAHKTQSCWVIIPPMGIKSDLKKINVYVLAYKERRWTISCLFSYRIAQSPCFPMAPTVPFAAIGGQWCSSLRPLHGGALGGRGPALNKICKRKLFRKHIFPPTTAVPFRCKLPTQCSCGNNSSCILSLITSLSIASVLCGSLLPSLHQFKFHQMGKFDRLPQTGS